MFIRDDVHQDADIIVGIKRRVRLMRACYKRFGPEQYYMTAARLSLKVRLLIYEMIETLLYGCVT